MEIALFSTAILFGLMTSFHCIGMCGAIALSLGLETDNQFKFVTQNLTYQIGRVITYGLFGLIIGVFGKTFNLIGIQQYVSIISGVLLILMVLFPGKAIDFGANSHLLRKMMTRVKINLGQYIQRKDYTSRLITGIINGFLPCGPVYVALTASLAAGSVFKSWLYMIFFGLGTIPMMFVVVFLGNRIGIEWRNKITKLFPYITILIGILFILRGLSLGIPFLSPVMENLKVE